MDRDVEVAVSGRARLPGGDLPEAVIRQTGVAGLFLVEDALGLADDGKPLERVDELVAHQHRTGEQMKLAAGHLAGGLEKVGERRQVFLGQKKLFGDGRLQTLRPFREREVGGRLCAREDVGADPERQGADHAPDHDVRDEDRRPPRRKGGPQAAPGEPNHLRAGPADRPFGAAHQRGIIRPDGIRSARECIKKPPLAGRFR